MNQRGSKSFFLISFLPAVAYWYLEANYPVRIAVAGGLIMAVTEIALEHFFTKHVHSISKFNFFLILILGGVSLLDDDGLWFRLQPTFTGLFMGGYLIYKIKTGQGLFLEMMKETSPEKKLPEDMMKRLEGHLGYFMIAYGLFMIYFAIHGFIDVDPALISVEEAKRIKAINDPLRDRWLFWKTAGFYIAFFIFMVGEFISMRKIKQVS